jgi:RHS repeat-associated protein
LSSVSYEPFGPARGWTWGNSTTETRLYNTDGNASQISGIESTNYTYDNAFRITGIANSSHSNLSWTYGYDSLDRLTSGSGNSLTQGFTYDANGNRLTETGTVSGTYTISTTSNRLSSITGTPARTYSYDAAGNTLGDTAATFTFNDRGRMSSATASSATTSYIYNALGQRIEKTGGPAGTALYLYDEAGHLAGEYTSTGALIEETVWVGDTPVATIQPASGGGVTVYYVHADHLNSPRMITRSSDNSIMWRWDADPFGTAVPNQNPSGLGTFGYNLRFPGQYYDTETGLNYNYFRDYDPATGRYVESDPIGLRGGLNTYGYAGNSPVRRTDPRGLAIWICSRAVNGFPIIGNHSYLWNDKTGKSCGKQGAFGFGPMSEGEKGPSNGDSCTKVPGSDGVEDNVMNCCRRMANDGPWLPIINDCQSLAGMCIARAGLQWQGAPGGRLGSCPSCNTYPLWNGVGHLLFIAPAMGY